jgi:hypothetical protein
MAHSDARYNVDDGNGRHRPLQYSHQQHPLPPRPGSNKDEHRDSSSSYHSYNNTNNNYNYNEVRMSYSFHCTPVLVVQQLT